MCLFAFLLKPHGVQTVGNGWKPGVCVSDWTRGLCVHGCTVSFNSLVYSFYICLLFPGDKTCSVGIFKLFNSNAPGQAMLCSLSSSIIFL